MIRRVAVAVSTTLAAGLVSLAAGLPAVATPSDPAPDAADPRATAYPRNATTCADAKLPGEIVLGGGESSDTHLDIDLADVPEGLELTGIVVKGGDAYNVYPPTALTDLHAPLNNGGNIPAISHWFACAVKASTTTTPVTPPPGGGDESGGASAPTTTTQPAVLGSGGAVAGDELANTGFSATVPLLAGVALLALGGGLMLAVRRARRG